MDIAGIGRDFERNHKSDICKEIKRCRSWANKHNLDLNVAIEGGVSPSTIDEVVIAGANMMIADSEVFSVDDTQSYIEQLCAAVSDHGNGKRRYSSEKVGRSACGRFSRPKFDVGVLALTGAKTGGGRPKTKAEKIAARRVVALNKVAAAAARVDENFLSRAKRQGETGAEDAPDTKHDEEDDDEDDVLV
jgi:hypothetical protein